MKHGLALRTAMLVLMGTSLVLTGLGFDTVWAKEVFSDFSIQTNSDRSLLLFPSHRLHDMMVNKVNSDLYTIDIPYFSLDGEPRILVAPHPKVRFIRFSQVSKTPEVVRATILMQKGQTMVPRLREGHLYLDDTTSPALAPSPVPPSPEEGMALPMSNSAKADLSASTNVLSQSVSLSFDQEDLSTILNALAMKLGLRVFADAGVRGKFTIHAQDIPLRDVLRSLLLQKNFQYTLRGHDLPVISLNQGTGKMARELLFRDLSLRDALQTLSKMMGVNLIIHESVPDKMVNFYVENLSLDELLDLLINTNDLIKKLHNENTFVIMTKEDGKKYGVKQYRTFKLVNAKPDEVIKTISGSKSLSDKIDTSNISINERINAISVYETAENLELIGRIIQSVDEKLKQAIIEVKLLEINRTGLKQLGVSLDNYNIRVSDIGRIPRQIQLGATLDFLERENKAKVLASPKIRAVHMKKATINIGEVIPVPYFRYEVASSSFLGAQPQTFKEYRDVQVGIRLEVTPEISRDNEISLELNTTVDSVLDINSDGQIHKSNRSTNTYVRVKDGETVVLGGLINQNDSSTKQSPSLINKVPLLRNLFTNARFQNQDSEMIMLVTPHLVNVDQPTLSEDSQPGLMVEQQGSRQSGF